MNITKAAIAHAYKTGVEHGQESVDAQTLMFWNLQLLFMNMSYYAVGVVALNMRSRGLLVNNEFSDKAIRYANRAAYGVKLDEDEFNCLCTHLALQLAGLA